MSFIFSRSPKVKEAIAVANPPPAPVQLARSVEPTGDAVADAEKKKRRGGAGQRRGLSTVLTRGQEALGATTGKTLLGA